MEEQRNGTTSAPVDCMVMPELDCDEGQDYAELDRLIGRVTRMIERAGIHLWRVYPTHYEDGTMVVAASMIAFVKSKGGQYVKADMTFEMDNDLKEIQQRVGAAVYILNAIIQNEGHTLSERPLGYVRDTWGSFL